MLSSGGLSWRREGKDAAGQRWQAELREARGDPIPWCSERGRSQPSPATWYLLSSSTCTPMEWNSLWLRLSVSESEMASTCQRAEGEHWRAAPRCGAAAQHHPRHAGRLRAGSEPAGRSETHLDTDGGAPLPLPSQAPQLLPAGDGLDDERGGLGSGTGLDRRQVEGHGRHLGGLQTLGRVAAGRGVFGPGGAAGDLAGQVALMGGLGAALRRDGDEGFGFGSWRDGRWSFSVTEGCCGRGAG